LLTCWQLSFFFGRKIVTRRLEKLVSDTPLVKKGCVKKKFAKAITAKWQHPHNNDMDKP
jgi:hypothetical protein